jgi:hypothetical protein
MLNISPDTEEARKRKRWDVLQHIARRILVNHSLSASPVKKNTHGIQSRFSSLSSGRFAPGAFAALPGKNLNDTWNPLIRLIISFPSNYGMCFFQHVGMGQN